jgi:homoserine dehydrogenase
MKAALSHGVSVATTNKGPISLALDELVKLGKEHGAGLRYEGTVMSGTPFINMIKCGMVGCKVKKIEGILNGTTNFMLTKMAEGKTYAQALAEAQSRGYAEADPTGDVEGWDAAVKVSIMAKIFFGRELPVTGVDRTGITGVTPEKVRNAAAAGCKVKLLAGLEEGPKGFRAYVAPKNVPFENPLAPIDGATNAVTITTDNLGDVTIIGPGAGRRETGQALLEDIYAFSRGK